MLKRVLETEAMDSADEALDYNSMDHSEVNRIFVTDFLATGWHALRNEGRGAVNEDEILDLGTGTALIPIELCRRAPNARVLAVDVAEHMITVARQNVESAGLADRIRLERVDAKGLPYRNGQFAAVISNSIVHHIPEPGTVIKDAWRVTARGGLIFFRDLLRPADERTLIYLVDTYAAGATKHQRQMLEDSLRAALTVEEVRELIVPLGVLSETVQATSD
jgi:ubiquinone/menaquinone biosynthesis C-methylase UbiE